MNLVETHDLLTLAAKYDNRRFDDATTAAWREVLADLPFEDCRSALVEHFRTGDGYLMPAHVYRGAVQIDRDRRRRIREAREAEALAIESAERSRYDRSEETKALIAELRASLPDGDPDKLRRPEWLELERRREREATAEPNPHFVALPPPDGHPLEIVPGIPPPVAAPDAGPPPDFDD